MLPTMIFYCCNVVCNCMAHSLKGFVILIKVGRGWGDKFPEDTVWSISLYEPPLKYGIRSFYPSLKYSRTFVTVLPQIPMELFSHNFTFINFMNRFKVPWLFKYARVQSLLHFQWSISALPFRPRTIALQENLILCIMFLHITVWWMSGWI